MSQSRREFLQSKEDELRRLNEALEMQFNAATMVHSKDPVDTYEYGSHDQADENEDYADEEFPENEENYFFKK